MDVYALVYSRCAEVVNTNREVAMFDTTEQEDCQSRGPERPANNLRAERKKNKSKFI